MFCAAERWPKWYSQEKRSGNMCIAIINHSCLMVYTIYTIHLWWLGGWFIIAIPTLKEFPDRRFLLISWPPHRQLCGLSDARPPRLCNPSGTVLHLCFGKRECGNQKQAMDWIAVTCNVDIHTCVRIISVYVHVIYQSIQTCLYNLLYIHSHVCN